MINCFASKNSFWIDPQGHIRPCARYKKKMEHVTEFVSFSDITNSKKYIEIREELSNDKFPLGCVRCEDDEKKNLRSKRQFYDRAGLQEPHDFMIDISMGNFCNLKCRMCGPSNSSLWNSDYRFLNKIGLVNQANGLYADTGFDGYQLSDDDIDKLILHIKNVKGKIYLELKGGEPLIMPQTKTLVNRLIELPNAEKITLLIVTNGTVVPEWVDSVQHKISKLQLIVSVDGIGEVYNYIRGTNKFTFNDCFKNIEKFHAFKNIDLKFNVVVQNLNIHQMIEIHQLLTAFPKTTINYITLSMPSYLAVNVMPSTARDKIYENFLKNSAVFKNYETQMQHIYKLLLIEPLPETLEYFKKITVALDKKRKQDASAVLPHLFNR